MNPSSLYNHPDPKIYWRCRRGMLELDLMLQGFYYHKNYASSSASAKQAFLRLLDYPDTLLLELLLGQTISSDEEIQRVIQQIRAVVTH